MEDRKREDPKDGVVCDWCKVIEALGTFFVPGQGILNLCGNCKMMLMAVLIDDM